MKTAIWVKDCTSPMATGPQALYKLEPPLEFEREWEDPQKVHVVEFVFVSKANVLFSGPETYAFAADADGRVTDWIELDGSRKGVHSHEDILHNMGYEVKR